MKEKKSEGKGVYSSDGCLHSHFTAICLIGQRKARKKGPHGKVLERGAFNEKRISNNQKNTKKEPTVGGLKWINLKFRKGIRK